MKKIKNAFTLAEALIAIVIIGIVSAMTLPTLVTNINNVVSKNQKKIIEKKFLSGINLYNNLENGLSGVQYSNTEEFLIGLSKHYKIAKICSENNIKDCFPYKSLYDGDISVTLENITSNNDMGLNKEVYYDMSAFVSLDGIPFIIALRKDCSVDPDTTVKKFQDLNCFAIMYDYNSNKKPNRVGKDIVTIGNIYPKGYYKKIGELKITEPIFMAPSISKAECDEEISKNYGINGCSYNTDYWAGAMKYCHQNGSHMVKHDELFSIQDELKSMSKDEITELGLELTHGKGMQGLFWISDKTRGDKAAENCRYVVGKGIYDCNLGSNDHRVDTLRQGMCVKNNN